MKYLLDAHVLDWAQRDTNRLSAKVFAILSDAKPGELAVSDVTLSELARHLALGKIAPILTSDDWLRAALIGIEVLPVTCEIALRAAFPEWSHRDPCDRHIVATAAQHRLPLLTVDQKILSLAGVRGLKVIA